MVHREGNYLLGLVSATGLLAPSILPGPTGTHYPLSLAPAAYRARASKTDKVKALLWPVMNWFVSHTGRVYIHVCVCVFGKGAGREGMTLRGHGGDEGVTNKGQEKWGSVSQIKITKGGGARDLQQQQRRQGLRFIGAAHQRHHQGQRPQSVSKWRVLTPTLRLLIRDKSNRSHLCHYPHCRFPAPSTTS